MARRCGGCMNLIPEGSSCGCGFPEYAQNQPHQLPLGTVLRNQYSIGRVLGQGGFGITYLGWDHTYNLKVAIKEYFPSGLVSRTAILSHTVSCTTDGDQFRKNRDKFLGEAQTLAKLQALPGIARIYNLFEANGTAYIVMEYVEGVTLQQYIAQRGGRLSPEETFRLLRPVMETLSQVHQAGLIHRDISPDNIMIEKDGRIRVLDFGTARDVIPGQNPTHSTQAILKFGFAPTEQYQSRGNLGPWTDVYALCATIYYCLTGHIPPESLARLLEGAPLNWWEIPGLTESQVYTLELGMAIHAHERCSSVPALMEGLYQLTPQPTPQRIPPTVPTPPAPETKPRWKLWPLAGLGILAVLLLLLLLPDKEPETVSLSVPEPAFSIALPPETLPETTPTTVPETTLPEPTTLPPETVPSEDDIYQEAVAAYENGNYAFAASLFEHLSGYGSSDKYLRLIRIRDFGGNTGFGAVYNYSLALTDAEKREIDAAMEDFDFADTAEVMVWNSDVACYYLFGGWDTAAGDYPYAYFRLKKDSRGGFYYTRSENISKAISDCVSINQGDVRVSITSSNTLVFHLQPLSRDSLKLYSDETGNTFTLYRD